MSAASSCKNEHPAKGGVAIINNNMFNLSSEIKKVKHKIKPFENDLIIVIIIILVTFTAFGLYRLAELRGNKTPITIEKKTETGESGILNAEKLPASPASGFVASKNGTKYYYPWCSGVSRIKEENKVWFSSSDEAKKAGYSPASNCKGL